MSSKLLNEDLQKMCFDIFTTGCQNVVTEAKSDDEDDSSDKDDDKDDKEDKKDDEDDEESDDESDEEKSDSDSDSSNGNSVTSIFGGNISEDDEEVEEIDDDEGDEAESLSDDDSSSDDAEDSEDVEDDAEEIEDEDTEDEDIGSSDSEDKNGMDDLKEFGIRLMMFSTLSHFWHLNCDKSADHNTLNDLYNDTADDADTIIEAILSYTGGKILSQDGDEFDFGALDFNKDEDIDLMKDLRDDASSLVEKYSNRQGICNALGDLCQHLDTAIYKLAQFEC